MISRFPWRVEVRVPRLQDADPSVLLPCPFVPPTAQTIQQCTIQFQQDLHESFSFDFCDCCNEKVNPTSKLQPLMTTDRLLQVLEVCDSTEGLPIIICPVSTKRLHIHRIRFTDANFDPYVVLCEACFEDIQNNTVPLFSIKNHVYLEPIPSQLEELTLAEQLLISRVYKRSVIWQASSVDGKLHSTLNHHILCFENDIQNYTTILPRPFSELTSLLKIVFLRDSEMEQPLPQVGIVRRNVVLNALQWLQQNNPLYADIVIDTNTLDADVLHADVEFSTSEQDIQSRIPQHARFSTSNDSISTQLSNGSHVERSYTSGLYQVQTNVDDQRSFQIRGSLNNWMRHAPEGLLAQFHNNDLVNIFGDLSWIPMSYPVLFPLGRTGLGATRLRSFTFEEWVSHLLRIKESRFREHFDFPLFMFNLSQRRKVSRACK
jgi:hypothetical protein